MPDELKPLPQRPISDVIKDAFPDSPPKIERVEVEPLKEPDASVTTLQLLWFWMLSFLKSDATQMQEGKPEQIAEAISDAKTNFILASIMIILFIVLVLVLDFRH